MIGLVIKGSRDHAFAAAESRGISLGDVQERLDHCETLAECAESELSAVVHWFCEPIKSEPGRGFPNGSLLYYNDREERNR